LSDDADMVGICACMYYFMR